MLDDLNELKTFRAILAEGSLSAAARRLGVTLAVVSKRLATLESRVGIRLIHRTTRALSPTDEGVLLADVILTLEALEGGRATAGSAPSRQEPCRLVRRSPSVGASSRLSLDNAGAIRASRCHAGTR